MEELARRIILLRQELALSSEKLAQRIGTSHKTVINWEKNRGDPSLENLLALADLFGVSPDYLLGRTEERIPRSGADAERGPAGGRSDASDEEAVEGSARAASHRPKRKPRGSTRRPQS